MTSNLNGKRCQRPSNSHTALPRFYRSPPHSYSYPAEADPTPVATPSVAKQTLWRQFRHCKTLEGLAINFARCFAALHKIFRRLPRAQNERARERERECERKRVSETGGISMYILFLSAIILFLLSSVVFCSHLALAAFGAAYFMQIPLGRCCSCSSIVSWPQWRRNSSSSSRSRRRRRRESSHRSRLVGGFLMLLIYLCHSLT